MKTSKFIRKNHYLSFVTSHEAWTIHPSRKWINYYHILVRPQSTLTIEPKLIKLSNKIFDISAESYFHSASVANVNSLSQNVSLRINKNSFSSHSVNYSGDRIVIGGDMVSSRSDESLLRNYVKIFGVVALYWWACGATFDVSFNHFLLTVVYRFTSILTVFVNKALLSSETMNLDAPLFVTWIQCIVSAVLSMLLKTFRRPTRSSASVFSMDIAAKVLPLSILFTAMIATNNLCLKYVDVSFYYIGRSLTTVFNVILSYALLRQTSSYQCILCCAMIVGGFWLGVDQERIAGNQFVMLPKFPQFKFSAFFQILFHWLAPFSVYWAQLACHCIQFIRKKHCPRLAMKSYCSAITWMCMQRLFSFRLSYLPVKCPQLRATSIFGDFGSGRPLL